MKRYLGQKKLLRIYIDNADMFEGKPLWQWLITQAKVEGLAGATVFKGAAGMGAHSQVHTFEIWSLAQKLPLVIEMIDDTEKIESFLSAYGDRIAEGLVTLHDVEVLRYNHPKFQKNPS